jgi:hypothetical protein
MAWFILAYATGAAICSYQVVRNTERLMRGESDMDARNVEMRDVLKARPNVILAIIALGVVVWPLAFAVLSLRELERESRM